MRGVGRGCGRLGVCGRCGGGLIEFVAGAEDGGGGEAALGGSGVGGDDDIREGFEGVGSDEGGEEGALAVGHGFETFALLYDLLGVEPVVELID